MSSDARKTLSRRLLGVALLVAIVLDLLFSGAQIAYDLRQTRQAIERDGAQLLDMFRAASIQAAYRRDQPLALQVVEGLLGHPGVRQARIQDGNGAPLAVREHATPPAAQAWLSDPLFGHQQQFTLRLSGPPPRYEPYGELALTLDAAYRGGEFFATSRVILATALTRVLLLGLALLLLFRRQLTHPLSRLLEHLARIDPERPDHNPLPPLKGHERDELGRWADSINRLLATIARHNRQRREAEGHLKRLTQFDLLTGLPNRQLLQQQLGQILSDSARTQGRVAVLCLGLDDFNLINEKYGYQSGDRLLIGVAERLRALDPRLGSLARLGSDQFALVQIAVEQTYEAAELAQRVLDDLARPLFIDSQPISLRASLGITLYPEDGDNSERLLQRAEQTMTLAKQGARSHYQFFLASRDREIRRRRQLEDDLRQALHNGQLELYYQPQVAAADQRIVAVEALLRWRHPQLGFVPPDQFIPLAEQNGLILEIGDWVLEHACRQLHDWHAQGLVGLRMAVNLSTAQLRSDKLPRQVTGLLQRHGLPAHSLELEITETGLMTDVAAAAQQLHSLRLAKVLLAIDDFGTGYSSLSYLKTLPLDKIKIDRSFVRDLTRNEDDATLVRTIIQLAHNLNMTVIAEGVETAEQEAYLIAHGCQESQGYLHCRPLPALEVTRFMLNAARRQRSHGGAPAQFAAD
ncbi:diguanylate cyclase (GGDEF) domain-containing protein [Pseudomonas linyingensis]|uniref:cyclic-guanylate-specific phosphodiesterase n=1 Tax=Pseudomonas linyingensis TaxID=915471 RepID=A0A1H6SJJ1_9PSED|nr:bifunctional diguanylate cyclase/phosphodiesterase [Pseudomonas linyingensis]SEI66084.1 diguanylate cyclase (GGDEF) domain-containing protein [Pseudomonas linyingensis]